MLLLQRVFVLILEAVRAEVAGLYGSDLPRGML